MTKTIPKPIHGLQEFSRWEKAKMETLTPPSRKNAILIETSRSIKRASRGKYSDVLDPSAFQVE